MSRRLYSSFQQSNHHENGALKTAHTQTFWFCLAFIAFLPILQPNRSFVVGADGPNMLLSTSDHKVNKSPTKKRAGLHKVLFAPKAKAKQLNKKPFIEVPTDRKPAPVMGAETIRVGIKTHDKALYIKSGWIRDPYISIGP